MKFSVIIPVYNSEKYLNKCIDSIVTQDYENFELILVDDGSSDSSQKICREYADRFENVSLICQENSGPSAARNRGIDCAKGDYITFVDSDDWVRDDYFIKLEAALNDEPDVLFFGTNHISKGTGIPKAFPELYVIGNNNAYISRVVSRTPVINIKAPETSKKNTLLNTLRQNAIRFLVIR